MLKLKLEQHHATLTLKFREKEPLFSPLFFQALATALGIHITLFLAFHITPFSFISTFTFPPVAVDTSLSDERTLSVTTIHPEISDHLLSPPQSMPLPSNWIDMPWNLLLPSVNYDVDRLSSLESADWPLLIEPLPIPLEQDWVTLKVSGELSQRKIISHDPIFTIKRPLTQKPPVYAFIDYRVYVDEYSGKIFWYELLRHSGIAPVDKMIEKILKNLQFDVEGTLEANQGILHFSIMIEGNHD